MTLIMTVEQLATMKIAAETAYPEECCGLLLGVQAWEEGWRRVQEVRPLPNQWDETHLAFTDGADGAQSLGKHNRYWVDPKALMQAQREARDRGWIVLGVYHSHPDHPARPSERDRRLAWADYSYPILSVLQGTVVDLQSWRFSDDRPPWPEKIQISP